MASRRLRNQLYDLNNPANWTAAQLRVELSQRGFNFTSTVPKSVLKQVYEQTLNSSNNATSERNYSSNSGATGPSDQSENVSSQTVQGECVSNVSTSQSAVTTTNTLTATPVSAIGQTSALAAMSGSTPISGSVASMSSNNDATTLLVQNTL